MSEYRGLTWDHDRGRKPLEAANRLLAERGSDFKITWDSQSLEGFESAPIGELFKNYDIIILDHPHVGDAIETEMMRPIDEILDAQSIRSLERQFVGPSLESYQVDGTTWALPLDAATQVAAKRPDLVDRHIDTWDEVLALSERSNVALSLAGPHAFLSFLSAYAGLEGKTEFTRAEFVVDQDKAAQVIMLFQSIYENRRTEYIGLNPIGLLELMSSADGPAYVPLVYGYVNYSGPDRLHPVLFEDVPMFDGSTRYGSIIGGSGLGVSRAAEITPEFVAYLRWLISPEAQRKFIPQNEGQPATTEAWQDDHINEGSRNFYRSTFRTIEDSTVRPRFPRYTEFQSLASQIVRDAVAFERDPSTTITALHTLAEDFTASMAPKYA